MESVNQEIKYTQQDEEEQPQTRYDQQKHLLIDDEDYTPRIVGQKIHETIEINPIETKEAEV